MSMCIVACELHGQVGGWRLEGIGYSALGMMRGCCHVHPGHDSIWIDMRCNHAIMGPIGTATFEASRRRDDDDERTRRRDDGEPGDGTVQGRAPAARDPRSRR
jgi:hypothetical protein